MSIKRTSLMWKIFKVSAITVGSILLLALLFASPIFFHKTPNMNVLQGEFVTVYYEKEKIAAEDVFQLAEERSEYIATEFGLTETQNIDIYIYDKHSIFLTKLYGLFALVLNFDWVIAGARGTDVFLTSPADASSTPVHYDFIKFSVVHELVHAYNNSIINKKMPRWIDEGLATYIANQFYPGDHRIWGAIPTIEQTQTANSIEFQSMNGYSFSFSYIDYLQKTYGWDAVKEFAHSPDYNYTKLFGTSENEIYDDWVNFLQENRNSIFAKATPEYIGAVHKIDLLFDYENSFFGPYISVDINGTNYKAAFSTQSVTGIRIPKSEIEKLALETTETKQTSYGENLYTIPQMMIGDDLIVYDVEYTEIEKGILTLAVKSLKDSYNILISNSQKKLYLWKKNQLPDFLSGWTKVPITNPNFLFVSGTIDNTPYTFYLDPSEYLLNNGKAYNRSFENLSIFETTNRATIPFTLGVRKDAAHDNRSFSSDFYYVEPANPNLPFDLMLCTLFFEYDVFIDFDGAMVYIEN